MNRPSIKDVPPELRGLYDQVLAAAELHPEFAKLLAERFGRRSARTRDPVARAGPGRSRRRRPAGILDPFALLTEGEDLLRSQLATLSLDQLKDIVAEHGMDSAKLAMKWKKPERVAEFIVTTVRSRLAKGAAFRSRDDVRGQRADAHQAPTPTRRYMALLAQLAKPSQPSRTDAIQDALRESFESAAPLIADVDNQVNIRSSPDGQTIPAGMAVAAAVSEEFLSVGLAAVKHDDLRLCTEWLDALMLQTQTSTDVRTDREHWIVAPAAMLAAYGAGALAWYRRRFHAVRAVVDASLEMRTAWIHQRVLGDKASRVVPWTVETLSSSQVIRQADSVVVSQLEDCIFTVAGLVALRELVDMPDAELQQRLRGGPHDLPTDAWPGLYFPTAQWTSNLAGLFRSNSNIEHEVSHAVFRMAPNTFRDECRRVTPALARSIHRVAHGERRNVHWALGSVGAGWKEWCGGVA
jgi:hypothetical protein